MKKNIYFKKLPLIGDLLLEHVLLSFEDEPILFICSNEDKKIYLCLCSDIRGIKRWVVSKTSVKILEDLIDHKMDLYSAFEFKPNEYKFIFNLNDENKINYSEILFKDINELDLPEKMVYLEYFNEDSARKFVKYIEEKQILQINCRNTNYNTVKNELNSSIQTVFQSVIQKFASNNESLISILNHVGEKDQTINVMYSLNSSDTKQQEVTINPLVA